MVEVKNKGHESEVSYLMWMVSGGAGVAVTGSPQMDCYGDLWLSGPTLLGVPSVTWQSLSSALLHAPTVSNFISQKVGEAMSGAANLE